MTEIKKFIEINNLGKVLENVSFKMLTTLKIGGNISLVFYPETISGLLVFYNYIKKRNVNYFVIGAGSNILASDSDYYGVVIKLSHLAIKYAVMNNKVICYAGMMVNRLSYDVAHLGYEGLEFLSGIPASLGGAVAMNASYNGISISDVLIDAWCLNKEGKIVHYSKKDLLFSYRTSKVLVDKEIVLFARFKVKKEKNKKILKRLKNYSIRRNETQPLGKYSAGCAFKNPLNIPAWYLIASSGLKGYKIGEALVSDKHANFIINDGNATSKDMLELLEYVKSKVKDNYNIELKNEWILVNFD